jgi:ADP-ribosylglycohydrolase
MSGIEAYRRKRGDALLGAITGDIVGSPYEFNANNIKTTEFPLFGNRSRFTDDTIMTLAVAEGIMNGYGDEARTEAAIVAMMRKYGALYPNAGYGAKFSAWLKAAEPKPYGSFGNGSAMRVSPVAWAFDDLETVERYAAISARMTHNHPEGIKGAQATAGAIFLARTGSSKAEIREYVETRYQYDLSRTLNEIRPGYRHEESCQKTVPEAIIAFLEAENFEDALRKAVSLGGDSDTLAAITGSIAIGAWNIPEEIKRHTVSMLDPVLRSVLTRWDDWTHKNGGVLNKNPPEE